MELTPSLTILIADDDADIRASLRFLLEGASYRVQEAINGMSTVDYLRKQRDPAVVLLDLTMPQMSGFDVLRTLADDTNVLHRTRFVLLTAHHATFASEETGLLQQLRVPLLQKPFDIDTLLHMVAHSSADLVR